MKTLYKAKFICLLIASMVLLTTGVRAEEETSAEETLAQASVEKCKATADDELTPELVIEKVKEACKLLEAEGPDCFEKFQGAESDFIFGGTYLTVHDLKDSVVKMHPIKHKLVGKSLAKARDGKGKLFFAEMNQVASEKGHGWIEYYWPKPGEKELSVKATYVDHAKHGDVTYVITCGIYDLALEDIKKAE